MSTDMLRIAPTAVTCLICAAPLPLLPVDSEWHLAACGHFVSMATPGVLEATRDPIGTALRFQAFAEGYRTRYPLADPTLTLEEQADADTRTLRAVLRERAARQAGLVIDR